MKTKLSILFLSLAIFLLVFASATNDNQTLASGNETNVNETNVNTTEIVPVLISEPVANITANAKNMTYGRCVSEFAKAEKACYKSGKDKTSSCKSSADKNAKKTCNAEYKKDLNQCKSDFKSSKQTCKQYKKTFADKIKFWQ